MLYLVTNSVCRNYPEHDSDCESDLSGILSYVAYKDNFCFNAALVEYPWEWYFSEGDFNGSLIYTVEEDGNVFTGKYYDLGCVAENNVWNNTLFVDTCENPNTYWSPHVSEKVNQRQVSFEAPLQQYLDQKIYDIYLKSDVGKQAAAQQKDLIESKKKSSSKELEEASSYYSYYFDAKFTFFYGYTRNPYEWIVFPHATSAPVKVPTMAPTKSEVYSIEVTQVS